ncbi:hypothetical protein Peur_052119 [Populus x canadensis]
MEHCSSDIAISRFSNRQPGLLGVVHLQWRPPINAFTWLGVVQQSCDITCSGLEAGEKDTAKNKKPTKALIGSSR